MTTLTQRLHTYSLLCGIAYSPRQCATEQFEAMGYNPIRYVDAEGVQAFVLLKHTQVYCVIRGTDELRDWLRNANINTKQSVNAGAYNAANIIGKLPRNCIVMGHSLGGAIASVFHGNDRYSFGAPKCWDVRGFAGGYIRVTNCNDIAPKLPPNLYHPDCVHLHLTHDGNLVKDPSWRVLLLDRIRGRIRAWQKRQAFTGYYDHSLEQYQKKLSKI